MSIADNSNGSLSENLTLLESKLANLESKLASEGPSINLLLERQMLSIDVLNAYVDSYDTEHETFGKSLNERGGQVYRDILSGIEVDELLEMLESDATELQGYGAGLLVQKFDQELGINSEWKIQNEEQYFVWFETHLKHSMDVSPEDKAFLAQRYAEIEDYDRAIELFEEAIEDGAVFAAEELGDMYCDGDIPEDGALAKKYYEIAIRKFKSPRAMVSLARLYLAGELIEEDERQAYLLARKAAKQQIGGRGSSYQNEDIAEGAYLLATCYEFGFGTRVNRPKAYQIYRDLGSDYSEENHVNIAKGHLDGIGIKQDVEKAISILEKLANGGSEDAASQLASIYSWGKYGVQKKTSFKFYLMAASRDDPQPLSCYQLGCCYLYGDGVEEDESIALSWFQKAYSQVNDQGHYLAPGAFEHVEGLLFGDD